MNGCNTYKRGCWRDDLKIWDSGITNMRLGISDYFPAMTKTHGSLPLSGLYVKYHDKIVRPKSMYHLHEYAINDIRNQCYTKILCDET